MATETQDYTGVGGQGPTPAKFSRYRSVRKAASSNAQGMAPLNTAITPVPTRPSASMSASQDNLEFASCQQTTIKKSMSRYRRQKPSTPNLTDAPPLPMTTEQYAVPRTQPTTDAYDDYAPRRPSTKDSHSVDATKPRGRLMGAMRLDTHGKGLFGGNGNTSSDTEQDERERDRQAAMASLTGETPVAPSGYQRPATRGRAATDREVPRVTDKRYQVDSAEGRRHSLNEPKRKSFKDAMKFPRSKERKRNGPSVDAGAETNAPTLFPGIDAPVSAVNAGERRVLVQYKKECLKLSVSPSTSAYDLLVSASRKVSEIDPPRFILMESFTAQGLERPLRQYECIRDVMNSWAHDTENTLIIVPAPSVYALDFLAAPNVPTNPPMDATFHIYYSQKPRKWDKRYLTIRSDGQIVLSKKEMTKEQTNVCHLSDFDIYSPTPGFLSQKVKPPKKICYAIKSQQKASMFLTTENFIHFFATNDKSIADGWYRAVQTWRSWYLVNKLGAGQAEDEPVPVEPAQIRSFKPLLASIDTSIEEESSTERPQARQTSARRGSSREHGPPPSSFPKSLAAVPDPEPATTQSPEESPFSAGGLLGRTYTLRQKAMKEREDREKREAEVLFNQGLVGSATTTVPASSAVPRQTRSGPASRTNSITSAQHQPEIDSLLKRSHSIKQGAGPQGKPLVDLTPVYQEPPQHSRKGRGVAVDTGGPLIDAATGLSNELAGGIAIPPAKTWRRPTLTGPGPTLPTPPPEPQSGTGEVRSRNRSRSNTARSRHHNAAGSPASPASPPDLASPLQEQAFVPNSLLARSGTMTAATGVPIGHGVATGDRNATKPMLDVTPQSPFAEGSLLRGL
ncbi:uncharacterized protein DSM5745_00160 [Aspergillus mulundensis]|uniref:PH domain-containing protein n=1 Tax=Aspergillus mulundensis TaxID=1810919 RepID=A0A3D8T4B5_9EURO|nr:Uncharacterized protein DSM5745_00160 [Aspergillus mulundensis]RDW92838.1 Uncharacterized protein DSM5745_00160 [Aspergillus mulundensis]